VEDVEEQKVELTQEEIKRCVEQGDVKIFVDSAVKGLSNFYQEVITLKFLKELTNKEIAEILGKSETAIRQAQCRALKKLRERFKGFKDI